MEYSVLMSVCGKEKPNNFKVAIESMLCQTVAPDDFVIICDGPLTEELDEVLDGFVRENESLFHIVRLEKNSGLGNALKIGVPECRCELIARMDSDDYSLPDRMEKLLPLFEDGELAVAGGFIREFLSEGNKELTVRQVPLTDEEIKKMIGKRNPMNHVTTVFRKQNVLDVGNYVEINRFEDYWLWARLILGGYKLINIEDIVVKVRADGMFVRRKGKEFFNGARVFQKKMYRSGLISYPRYLLNLFVWFLATMVVGNRMKSLIYTRFLRKSNANGQG